MSEQTKIDLASFAFAIVGASGVSWYFKSKLVVTPHFGHVKSVAMGVRG